MGRRGSNASSTQGHIFMRVSSASCLAYPVGKKAQAGRGKGARQAGGTGKQARGGRKSCRQAGSSNVYANVTCNGSWNLQWLPAFACCLFLSPLALSPFPSPSSALPLCSTSLPAPAADLLFPLTTPCRCRCCCCLSLPYIKYPASLCGASCGAHTGTHTY